MPPLTPRRYYRKEWVRHKPHLPKSTSLPIFKLLPVDRPIFTCQQCGFINTLIPLCLWCRWTSKEALSQFENSAPRARRASEPPRFRQILPTAILNSPNNESRQVSITIIKQTVALQSVNRTDNIRLSGDVTTQQRSVKDHTETTASPSLRVANATAQPPTSVRAKSRSSWLNEDTRKAAGTAGNTSQRSSLHFPCLRHSVSAGVDRRRPMHLIKTFSTKSLRSTPIVINFKAFHETHDVNIKSASNNPHLHDSAPSIQKTLRRKKRISLFRTSAPTPLRPPSSSHSSCFEDSSSNTPQLNLAASRDTNLAYGPDALTHSRSKSQPSNIARLGHPSRPYYTAIRSNMSPPSPSADLPSSHTMAQFTPTSRPTRPMSLPTPSRAPSPSIFSVLSPPSAFSEEEEEPDILRSGLSFRPRAFSANSYTQSRAALGPGQRHHSHGFSLSGETELRMALAEQRNSNVGDSFKFQDMGKKFNAARVFNKVREFKKGLKGFVGK